MPTRSPTITTELEHDDAFAAVWSNPQAGSSQASFSSAIRRNDVTPSKRRRGSEGLARRGRADYDPWPSSNPPPSPGVHNRSRTVDDEAGMGSYWLPAKDLTQYHPLRHSASHASTSSWTLDHGTRPSMRKILSSDDADKRNNEISEEDHPDHSLVRDREMLVIIHEVSSTLCHSRANSRYLVAH